MKVCLHTRRRSGFFTQVEASGATRLRQARLADAASCGPVALCSGSGSDSAANSIFLLVCRKKRNNPRHNRDFLLGIKEESTTGIVLKILECSVVYAKGQDSQSRVIRFWSSLILKVNRTFVIKTFIQNNQPSPSKILNRIKTQAETCQFRVNTSVESVSQCVCCCCCCCCCCVCGPSDALFDP